MTTSGQEPLSPTDHDTALTSIGKGWIELEGPNLWAPTADTFTPQSNSPLAFMGKESDEGIDALTVGRRVTTDNDISGENVKISLSQNLQWPHLPHTDTEIANITSLPQHLRNMSLRSIGRSVIRIQRRQNGPPEEVTLSDQRPQNHIDAGNPQKMTYTIMMERIREQRGPHLLHQTADTFIPQLTSPQSACTPPLGEG